MAKIDSSRKVTSTAPLTSLRWMVALCHTVTRALPFRRLAGSPGPCDPLQNPKTNRTQILKEQEFLKYSQKHPADKIIANKKRSALISEDESAPCVVKTGCQDAYHLFGNPAILLVRTRGFASPDYSGFARSENVIQL